MKLGIASWLSERSLWFRHAWWFQWAHKPLCSAYSQDVLRLGRLRICRSCVAVYLGAAFSLGATLWFRPSVTALLMAWIVVTTSAAVGSFPTYYRRHGRRMRDVLRALLGASIPLALAPAWSGSIATSIVLAGSLVLLRRVYGRIRAVRGRPACENCEEKDRGICSGYADQAVSIRAYEEALTEQYLRAGFVPKSLTTKR